MLIFFETTFISRSPENEVPKFNDEKIKLYIESIYKLKFSKKWKWEFNKFAHLQKMDF